LSVRESKLRGKVWEKRLTVWKVEMTANSISMTSGGLYIINQV